MMFNRIKYIALLAMILPASGAAQSAPEKAERVRIHERGGVIVTGTLQSASPQGLRVRSDVNGVTFLIPSDSVEQFERSLGKHRRFGRNFALTVAASSFAVGTVMLISYSPCTETGFLACFMEPHSAGEAFTWGLAGGAAVGVPLGVIVGLALRNERWERASVPGQGHSSLSIRPIIGRQVGLTASIAFGGR